MKKILIIVLSLIITHTLHAQKKRVLFLGNSYTYVNNLPQLVADIALSAGDTLLFDSNTPGGYTLQNHFADATSVAKIQQGNWDFVVLQEQSQLPSFPDAQVQVQSFPYAAKLDSLIRLYNPCGETMFYMTWGRKNGDASNCAVWPPVCTYQGMDSLLYLRYMMMADSSDAVVSPVGAVWKYIRTIYPAIELYSTDESHPSVAGSYAAACSFYTCIFRKNPLNITTDGSLSAGDALSIRQVAKIKVYDSLYQWHVGEYDPQASFTYNINNNTVNFINLSTNATDYHWNFGDGNFSNSENPEYTFTDVGDYSVELISTHCQQSDTFTAIVPITVLSIDKNMDSKITVYPNPAKDKIYISAENRIPIQVEIFDSYSREVVFDKNKYDKVKSVDISTLPAGMYNLKITFEDKIILRKLIKE